MHRDVCMHEGSVSDLSATYPRTARPTHHRAPLTVSTNTTREERRLAFGYDGRILDVRSEEHTSELQSRLHLVCRLLLEKKKNWREKRARANTDTTIISLISFYNRPLYLFIFVFFFNDTATTEIYTLSLHDALPICSATYPRTARPTHHRAPLTVSTNTTREERRLAFGYDGRILDV